MMIKERKFIKHCINDCHIAYISSLSQVFEFKSRLNFNCVIKSQIRADLKFILPFNSLLINTNSHRHIDYLIKKISTIYICTVRYPLYTSSLYHNSSFIILHDVFRLLSCIHMSCEFI